jgi:hypothetical protein
VGTQDELMRELPGVAILDELVDDLHELGFVLRPLPDEKRGLKAELAPCSVPDQSCRSHRMKGQSGMYLEN